MDDARVLGGAPHRVCLVRVQRERLLAEDVLAGARGCDRRLRMEHVLTAVHEEAYAVVSDLLTPVVRRLRPAEPGARLLDGLRVTTRDGHELRLERRAELPHGRERARVRIAHEAIAEHRDADPGHSSRAP